LLFFQGFPSLGGKLKAAEAKKSDAEAPDFFLL